MAFTRASPSEKMSACRSVTETTFPEALAREDEVTTPWFASVSEPPLPSIPTEVAVAAEGVAEFPNPESPTRTLAVAVVAEAFAYMLPRLAFVIVSSPSPPPSPTAVPRDVAPPFRSVALPSSVPAENWNEPLPAEAFDIAEMVPLFVRESRPLPPLIPAASAMDVTLASVTPGAYTVEPMVGALAVEVALADSMDAFSMVSSPPAPSTPVAPAFA